MRPTRTDTRHKVMVIRGYRVWPLRLESYRLLKDRLAVVVPLAGLRAREASKARCLQPVQFLSLQNASMDHEISGLFVSAWSRRNRASGYSCRLMYETSQQSNAPFSYSLTILDPSARSARGALAAAPKAAAQARNWPPCVVPAATMDSEIHFLRTSEQGVLECLGTSPYFAAQ